MACSASPTAVFRFLRTQSFKRLLRFDVLALVNQSYEHDRTAFIQPTYLYRRLYEVVTIG